jgi:hypothetical protein
MVDQMSDIDAALYFQMDARYTYSQVRREPSAAMARKILGIGV